MTCDECRDLILTDFLDGELSPEKGKELMAHVAGCEICRALKDNASRDLLKPFQNLPRPALPPHIWDKITKELDADPIRKTAQGASRPGDPEIRGKEWNTVSRISGPRPWLLAGVGMILVVIMILVAAYLLREPVQPLPEVRRPVSVDVADGLIGLYRTDRELERILNHEMQFGTAMEKFFFPAELFPPKRLSK